jgi:UDP-N-acetylmuramoyl-L-alanyl-D-glutamate--2,6-diaminopimelate ligase
MRDRGCQLVAAEVSSHALALHRVAATRFAVAAFTNLSQDHLDFHGDMESYLEAKTRLFNEHEVGVAVLNIDDPAGRRIAGGYGGEKITVGAGGDVRVVATTPHLASSEIRLHTPWGEETVSAPVVGSFNIENVAIAAACCLAAGIDFGAVMAGLEDLGGVPGRYEVVSGDDPVRVIVDYAHTPDGIAAAILAARQAAPERLIALVGAGGDRDREKRPLMGEALSRADHAYITSDNPRSEDPGAIAAEVLSGVPPGSSVTVEVDRRLAIGAAVARGEPGDIVLILGRGHEPFQEVGGERRPFDDRQVAREALASLRGNQVVGDRGTTT